ncbi:arginine utilization protein RocB [Pararhizobium capsulatum DSM 1112]|uniref:Arginine utilization protein RocB n=1 Tax=Pararhizobium capsulatum DSM 1112 TaxID=1121113 RepID=A0ABU0BRC6_9HYPH|nr:M20/M25/M40 family metallo-hydrolase [Pararhizobium capsulatum]MDQ0320789.1 arginine utilization protein RocB [Pararhizobium capsulatum DSM 1112]
MTESIKTAALPRAGQLSVEMTRWPSVTGSEGEAAFSARLVALLRDLPAFRDTPENIVTFDSHGDSARQNVVALVRGTGRNCLVLAGHFDTVSIANYTTLTSLACEPEALTQALIEELSSKERNAVEEKALADLLTGDFLAGRGLLDMKSGLAAGIVALERYADLKERPGNILFVATPDEENRSRGMRSLRDHLPEIARRFDLDIVGGINLDASGDDGDGAHGRAVYLGSVGKFSPFAFVAGRPTHAGYAYDGVSAHLIAAEIMRAMEFNSLLCDEAHGEVSPAPVCLEAKDIRHGYEVTTPAHVWLSFNWLTHRRTPTDILDEFSTIVARAMDQALQSQTRNADAFFSRQGIDRNTRLEGRVLSYAALRQLAERQASKEALRHIAALEQDFATSDEPLSASRTLVSEMLVATGLEGPLVVVGFSTLHYPRVHVDSLGQSGSDFTQRLQGTAALIEKRHGQRICFRQFFAGISDVSFFGHRPEVRQADTLAENTPVPAFVDRPPAEALSYPVVNIGPWGRDYHQKWERVHMDYAFEVLPDLIYECALSVLSGESPSL